jgi:hypothetical protein
MSDQRERDERSTDAPRIVYIISRVHSGTTLLDLLLSTHPVVVSVGEAKMLEQLPAMHCICGAEHWHTCPFWTRVDERLRTDGGPGVGCADIESTNPMTLRSPESLAA